MVGFTREYVRQQPNFAFEDDQGSDTLRQKQIYHNVKGLKILKMFKLSHAWILVSLFIY